MARFASKILDPKEVLKRLKGRTKPPPKQSGGRGGNVKTTSSKKPTSKPISDEKGHGRGKFQKVLHPLHRIKMFLQELKTMQQTLLIRAVLVK